MNENVNVCITPKGDKPVLHFSQFDNGRIFTVTVLADDGETAAVLTDLDIEFRLRKTDSHVVTVAPESVTDNVITFKTTEQMCACCGQNIASVVLMDNDTNIISTLDILVEIQRDIMSGGLTSESDIRNLTTQIEQIVPEVIGDDYYTKDQVDELIADIPTFDPTNYYDKSDVDGLLADKANADDVYTKSDVDGLLADKANADDVYTKTDVDGLLADKANADDVYTKSDVDDLLADKADADDVYTKTEVDNKINYLYPLNADYIPFIEGLISGTYDYVDLGDQVWGYNTNPAIQAFATGSLATIIRRNINDSTVATWLLCKGYKSDSINNTIGHVNDKRIAVNASGGVYISNFDYTDAPTFKAAMTGVYFIFELETPKTPTITQAELEMLIKAYNNNMVNVILKV